MVEILNDVRTGLREVDDELKDMLVEYFANYYLEHKNLDEFNALFFDDSGNYHHPDLPKISPFNSQGEGKPKGELYDSVEEEILGFE